MPIRELYPHGLHEGANYVHRGCIDNDACEEGDQSYDPVPGSIWIKMDPAGPWHRKQKEWNPIQTNLAGTGCGCRQGEDRSNQHDIAGGESKARSIDAIPETTFVWHEALQYFVSVVPIRFKQPAQLSGTTSRCFHNTMAYPNRAITWKTYIIVSLVRNGMVASQIPAGPRCSWMRPTADSAAGS